MNGEQIKGKWYQFIFARKQNELDSRMQKALFFIWNAAAIVLSSMALCAVSLNFAIGRYSGLFYIYLGYLRTPEIFLLNWLPLLLLQLLLFATMNTQWLAFLITGIIAMLMSIGTYFKLIFRSDPFTFSDLNSIRAGLSVAENYDICIDWRILLAILFLAVAAFILFFFAKGCVQYLGLRLIIVILLIFTAWFGWRSVYTDTERYNNNAYKNFLFVTRDSRDYYVANGFYYPFLYSITQTDMVQPDGYDETETEKVYSQYENKKIPDDRKVNIMVLQLESFSDLEAAGFPGIDKAVYAPLRHLQKESCTGTMVASVIGGGTVVTERAVLTGTYREQNYYKTAYSYVRYLQNQGYYCTVSHPNVSSFYTRGTINEYLGFEKGYYLDDYFMNITDGEWRCDSEYLPEIFRLFREQSEQAGPVFSFNISLQGHSPYNDESFDREDSLWAGDQVSDSTRYVLNNYLSQIKETQEILLKELKQINEFPEPMVFLIYGDHKPLFSDEVYEELGILNSMETEQGMVNYLGTPYLIWANQSAKEMLKDDMTGDSPLTSPGYLMNELFSRIGWHGPAFMQFTDEVKEHISVICTRGGYMEDGLYTQELSNRGQKCLKTYQNLLYYLHYRPELAG